MFSVLKPQTDSSTKATSKIKTSFEARMASEVMLKNISDNASFVSDLLSLDDANASTAKEEYDDFCRTLLSGKLLIDFESDGLSEIKVTNPTLVNNTVVTSYVKRQFFSDNDGDNLAIYPLAIPMLAGPAAIISVIVVNAGFSSALADTLIGYFALLAVMVSTGLILCLTVVAESWLNEKVTMVFSRITAIVLAGLSVQYVLDGLRSVTWP